MRSGRGTMRLLWFWGAGALVVVAAALLTAMSMAAREPAHSLAAVPQPLQEAASLPQPLQEVAGQPQPAPASVSDSRATYEIAVFFSRHPESNDDFLAVFPVTRTAPDAGVARAALRALIAGPTPAEAAEGYFSELGTMLVGPSSCGGEDFSIRIESGLATVRFCRTVVSAGVGQDARVTSALEATLLQFPTIQRVRLLTAEGDCLFDMSDENRCFAAPHR